MSLARNIIRGTFRLSIVAAVISAAYGLFEGVQRHDKKYSEYLSFKLGYECAARQDDLELRAIENAYGTIDISQLHCTERPFYVTMDEVQRVRSDDESMFYKDLLPPKFDFAKMAIAQNFSCTRIDASKVTENDEHTH